MSDLTPPGAESAPANDGPLSIREAASLISKRRETAESAPPPEPEAPKAKAPPQRVEPEPNSSQEDDDAPADERPSVETDQGEDDPAPEEPSIEPPRSWTKEEKEAFKLLPPEHQQKIAEREKMRETDIRRRQNEIAEQRKAAEAERQRLEQARQQYETALPQALQVLNAQAQAEFADIRTQADVVKLAEDDPFRYLKWDALQKQRAALHQQHQQHQHQRAQEQQQQFAAWAAEQDKKFLELAPDFADKTKRPQRVQEVKAYLNEIGFSDERIERSYSGQEPLYLRDAALQQLVYEASRWRAAREAAKNAAAKPLPPVQRPGTSPSKTDRAQTEIANLTNRLDRADRVTDQIRIAAQLRAAKRASAR